MEIFREKHYWLYVLKLEQGKYYIGITSKTPEARLKEHLGGRKTWWTEKYKPLEIIDKKYLGDLDLAEAKLYENRVTREYIKHYGISNVRGGDITTTSDLIVRFHRIFEETSWKALVAIVFLLLIIAILVIHDTLSA